MKNIPHDYYLRYLDPTVHEDVLDFHTKANYVIHEAFKDSTALHFFDEENLAALTGNELRLYPDLDLTIPIQVSGTTDILTRHESCNFFKKETIDFSIIEQLVEPMTTKSRGDYKRGYPSGGALYPIEIFVCSLMENESTWPCPEKILHLLPRSAKFEIIQDTECVDSLRSAILSASTDIGTPSVAIVYAAFLPKTMFKYRYRGYRLALMEAGSIYMLTELQAKSLQLRCRLWSAFTDTMLSKAIGLNPALFLPLCVHLIGTAK